MSYVQMKRASLKPAVVQVDMFLFCKSVIMFKVRRSLHMVAHQHNSFSLRNIVMIEQIAVLERWRLTEPFGNGVSS